MTHFVFTFIWINTENGFVIIENDTSAGTAPTTPNLYTEKQYQYSNQHQSGLAFSNNMGASGRS